MYVTLTQCAKLAGLKIGRARFYKDNFFQYFITDGEGKSTTFEQDSSVKLLKFIRAEYDKKMSKEQIVVLLDNSYGVVVTDLVVKDSNSNNNTATAQHEDLVQSIRTIFVEELNERDCVIAELKQRLERMESNAESRDNEIMERLRKLSEKKKWKFWK